MKRKNIKLVSSQQTVVDPPLKRTIPARRPRCAPARTRYYKTVCTECDVILGVQWHREFSKASFSPSAKRVVCQFCNGNRITTLEINEIEYRKINFAWDLDDLQSADENEEQVFVIR